MSEANAERGTRNAEREIARVVASITARHDQDEAEGRDWFRNRTPDERISLWLYINKDFDEPLLEVMSRLAILQFERYVLEEGEKP